LRFKCFLLGVLASWREFFIRCAVLAGLILACASALPAASPAPATNDPLVLARAICATCHVFPEPDLLDRKTWNEQTLPRMKIRLGLFPEMIEQHPEADLLKATGVFPTEPMIAAAQFEAIVDYYLQAAPLTPLPQGPRGEITVGLDLFAVEKPRHKMPVPSTTLVKISERTRRIYMGDAETQALGIYTFDGQPPKSMVVSNIPVSLSETPRGIYLTMIGKFFPSEDPKGEFAFLPQAGDRFGSPQVMLQKLRRPTHAAFADLNGDGKTDFLLSEYGNNVGRFCWFENQEGERYREHELLAYSGAISSVIHDFNGDGRPDIAVLVAQQRETLYLLLNDGHGEFDGHVVFTKPPSYGHSSMEVVDVDQDGRLDFLITNGDSGDYPSPTKRYHGIRLYLNRGDLRFEEAFFYPLNGAFGVRARDFDQDGDVDIAAISFFPDYRLSPRESFVYLENQGSLRFKASTFSQSIIGRWLVMDAGDLDGDGDVDLVLGSYINGPSEVPAALKRDWDRFSPSILILRNKLRAPKPPAS
jgi:hypothetical protein